MSKYSEMDGHELNGEVFTSLHGDGPEWIYNGEDRLHLVKVVDCFDGWHGHSQELEVYAHFDAVNKWDDCYPVMDALLAITTGINLKSDGTATTEIKGKQESSGGGHCRAICELYLMAKDSQNQLQNT
jgi:hypothetical protein